jgi:TetR/AcrR family transcriptional repressor of mexJK operon
MTQGYGAVSMDSISRAAGVSKATLYAYFASKDVLFATIIKEACLHNMALAGALPDLAVDLAAALTGLGQRVLRFLLEDQALAIHRVVMAESVRFPELGRAFYDNGPDHFRRLFSAWLDEQVKAGRLVVDDVGIASDQFVGMLRSTGVYLRASLGLPPRPTEAEINATVTGAVRTFLKAYAVA